MDVTPDNKLELIKSTTSVLAEIWPHLNLPDIEMRKIKKLRDKLIECILVEDPASYGKVKTVFKQPKEKS